MSDLPAPVTAHMARLDAALLGPPSVKQELLHELSDHLSDATDAYAADGHSCDEAARLAIADFGDVDDVAPALQTTLALASSRRTALWLLVALLPQPFLWDSGVLSRSSIGVSPPDSLIYRVLDTAVEAGGFLAMLTAALIVVATGLGRRWLPVGRHFARSAALVALSIAVAMPLAAGAMLALSSGTTPQLLALALLLLGVPLLVTAASARHTLAACA